MGEGSVLVVATSHEGVVDVVRYWFRLVCRLTYAWELHLSTRLRQT